MRKDIAAISWNKYANDRWEAIKLKYNLKLKYSRHNITNYYSQYIRIMHISDIFLYSIVMETKYKTENIQSGSKNTPQ